MHKIHPTGWRKGIIDPRDKVMRFGSPNLADLPCKIDLRGHCSAVEDQSTLGSCTANATVGALEYLEIKDGVISSSFENYSRLFVYYNTRAAVGEVNEDSGGTLREAVKSVADFGTCDEVKWTYDINKFTVKPSDECYADATNHKISQYHILGPFSDLLACLAEGYPFVFGFSVYSGFEGPVVAQTGVLQMPTQSEYCVGGHAVCAVGYDMDTKRVIVRNSWGTSWGQGGYFTMPFEYIQNQSLASDFWTIRR